jgi:site-specific DNA-methyltransferase (cytosine-N4-specific)
LDEEPATVINRNIFDVQPSDIPGDVGLVVTSPPYPNAYEYWLYHKYRMWWLGYDPLAVKSREIGARAHFFSGNRCNKEDFHAQMLAVFKLLAEVMCEGAYCCFLAGDSKIHSRIVDNAELLLKAAAQHGFKLVFKSDRGINPNRKSFNLHHARIKREHVLVWER